MKLALSLSMERKRRGIGCQDRYLYTHKNRPTQCSSTAIVKNTHYVTYSQVSQVYIRIVECSRARPMTQLLPSRYWKV